MGQFRSGVAGRAFCFLSFVCGAATQATHAAILFDTGTLQGSASAAGGGFATVPPPVVMGSGAATSYQCSIIGLGLSTASAETSASLLSGILGVSGSTSLSISPTSGGAGAGTSGTITFHETAGQWLHGHLGWLNGASSRGAANVQVRDASNALIMAFGAGPSGISQPGDIDAFFPPGTYSVTWSHGTQPVVGTGGTSSMSFGLAPGVPEPASLALLTLPLMLVRRRRLPR
jgi:hypothetical protein